MSGATHSSYTGLSLWWGDVDTSERMPLPGDLTVDIAIVGAGYTGLWTAYYLLKHDPSLRVAIIEREVAGFGASGRNGGWCSALFPASLDKMSRLSNRTDAKRLQDAMHATVDEVGRVAADEGIDIGWAKGGTVGLARTPLQMQRAAEEIAHMHSWGYTDDDYRVLGPDEARSAVGATDVLGATFTPHCARIHPAKLVRGLADVVERLGATIYERTAALAIEPGIVRTARGTVRAPYVVRATEGFSPALPGFRRAVAPVYSLMIATEPLPESVWAQIGLAERPTFNDGRHLIIYGQRTEDGRLAFGGRGAPYHFGSRVTGDFDRNEKVFRDLHGVLLDLFPAVEPFTITHQWGGPLGIPRDWVASCGLDPITGLAWSGGYVGDGVGTSNLGGRTLADLILGRSTDLVSLPWVNHRSPQWEPEPLRWFGANLGLGIMKSADAQEARTGRQAKRASVFGRFLGH